MALVRLDKWIAQTLIVSRKDASGMIRAGRVTVNGQKSVPDAKVDPETDTVTADGNADRLCEASLFYAQQAGRSCVRQ